MPDFVAAIDQGTTGTRCIIFDHSGSVVAMDYLEHAQIFPQPGWVEHDATEIWLNTTRVMQGAQAKAGVASADIAAVGITNQRETTVVWDRRTGEPLCNAIVWQCTRTQDICQDLIDRGLEPLFQQKTGLVVATYFAATKLRWMLDNVPAVRQAADRGDALFGTIDSWLIWHLTGGANGGAHVTDVTNASRTLLMDIETLAWDQELLDIMGIPRAMLPEIRPSSARATYGSIVGVPGFEGLPVCGAVGDQQAALTGQTCYAAGEAKNTYGTGSFLLMNTGDKVVRSKHGLLTTVAYGLEPGRCTYALEGSIAVTGAAVQWLRDNLRMIDSAAESEALAEAVEDSGGVYFVPAFSGLYAPHWDMYARGAIVGLTRFVKREHLVRATLESICYQSREVVDAMGMDAGLPLASLKVDGGASANGLLMQMQADILGASVVRPTVQETTALGAAYMAGLAVGFWDALDDLRANWQIDRVFEPAWSDKQRSQGYAGWLKAVDRCKGWAAPDA